MLTLDVAIATYQPEGIKRVEKMLLPPQEGVRYIVSWQEHHNSEIPDSLNIRSDVEVHRLEVKGLSNNRNNALKFCKGDIVLIADDDVEYTPDFATLLRKRFEENPEMDLATFKFDYKNPKLYPKSACKIGLPLPKNYYVSSIELAFRRKSIGTLRFWGKMGLGNEFLGCGEDELFLYNAIKRGLNCRFTDKKIGTHLSLTTGEIVSPSILRAQGFLIQNMYPFSSILRLPLKAFRIYRRHKLPFIPSLYYLLIGAFYKFSVCKKDIEG